MTKEESTKIIYEEIKKYDYPLQISILEDCGFASIINSHKVKSDKKSFEITLKLIIKKAKIKYGNKIKDSTWEGIYETLIKLIT